MKIFGIDPGSERTGYGCIESSGGRHRLVICGILSAPARATFPEKLLAIHARLAGAAGPPPSPSASRSRTSSTRRTCAAPSSSDTRAASRCSRPREAGHPGRRVQPRGDQALGGRVRPRREAAGAGHDEAAARPRRRAVAARRRRRARGRHLPHPHQLEPGRPPDAAGTGRAVRSWRDFRPLDSVPERRMQIAHRCSLHGLLDWHSRHRS